MASEFQIETTKLQLIDPIPIASIIEMIATPYLRPQHIIKKEISNVAYDMFGRAVELIEPVYNDVVIKDRYKIRNNIDTTIPVVGIEIIKRYIDRMLLINSAWSKQEVPSLQKIWSEFLLPEYEITIEVYELIESALNDIRNDIRDFINGEVWVMHFQRSRFNDIVIEKCQDFRIYNFMLEHGSEYKRKK